MGNLGELNSDGRLKPADDSRATSDLPGAKTVGIDGHLSDLPGHAASPESTASFHSAKEAAQTIGKFRLLRLVGRGAFGEVYQAYDTQLHRYVAVKLPRSGIISGPGESQFLREAKNVSRLQHPGIVPVFDMGRTEECCYIVSEFVEGHTLAQELRGKRLGFRDSTIIAIQLAEALDHAHRNGVIHRDLKPSNILLDLKHESGSSGSFREKLSGERPFFPRIVDFGLGKRSAADASISLEGHVLGTPSYMSPEQAAGNSHLVDGRSDVYSLGVILYELLTGDVPFHGETLLSQVLFDPPKPPRSSDRNVPRDLEVICLKCLEKKPRQRYQTAAELAEDLQRWLEGLPIIARRAGSVERAARWTRKRPWTVTGAVVIAALFIGLGLAFWDAQQTRAAITNTRLDKLLSASPQQLSRALEEVRELRPGIDARLKALRDDKTLSDREQVLLSLALSDVAAGDAQTLADWLLKADPAEVRALCQQARPYANQLTPVLAQTLDLSSGEVVLRAAAAIAQLEPENKQLGEAAATIAGQLARAEKEVIEWAQLLIPVKDNIHDKLKDVLTSGSTEQMSGSAQAFGYLYADRVNELCELLFVARDSQFMTLIEALRPKSEQAIATLLSGVSSFDSLRPTLETPEYEVVKAAARVLAVIALGGGEGAWPLWSVAPDPRLQTYLIHGYYLKRLSPDVLAQKVRVLGDSHPELQYAVLIAMSGYEPTDLAESEKKKLLQWLVEKYESHPDSGVHSSILWLLKHWKQGAALESVDARLIEQGKRTGFNWCLNSLGQTMILVRPRTGRMILDGSKADGHQAEAELSPFMIAATETTWKEYLTLFPGRARLSNVGSDSEPVRGLSWFDAAEFCRKLSEHEEMGTDCDAVVVANTPPQETATLRFDLQGYRPATIGEWEFATRATTATTRFTGELTTIGADKYFRHSPHEENKPIPVASLLPNQFGLFDVYGNVWEWTATEFTFRTSSPIAEQLHVKFGTSIGIKGGAWDGALEWKSSNMRLGHVANRDKEDEFKGMGIRVARTVDY